VDPLWRIVVVLFWCALPTLIAAIIYAAVFVRGHTAYAPSTTVVTHSGDLEAATVKLPDGGSVTCVVLSDDHGARGVTCDWTPTAR
jgi:hypothetical protein